MTTFSTFQWGAGTATGPAHRQADLPNQDAYALFASNQVLAAAVADGLGSRPQSHQGARWAAAVAASLAVDHLLADGPAPLPDLSLAELRARIILTWRARFGNRYRDVDSTLLLAALSPDRAILGQIGDGLMAVQSHTGNRTVFQPPDKPFQNVTTSLGHPDAFDLFQMEELVGPDRQDLKGLALMTDGVADDLEDPGAFCADALAMLMQGSDLSWGDTVQSWLEAWPTPGRSDDQTLIFVSLGGEAPPDQKPPEPAGQPARPAPRWPHGAPLHRSEVLLPPQPEFKKSGGRRRRGAWGFFSRWGRCTRDSGKGGCRGRGM